MSQHIENVNRTVLILKPKQSFHDWLLSIEPGEDFRDGLKEGDVSLLPDYEEISQMQNWLKRNYDSIFTGQLNNWYTDDTLWPQNRTMKMFTDWFECSLFTKILDTQRGKIEKT
ncbi:MAG: hypothetical protein DCC43_05185 [Candidatus Brocadia sp.]|nr:hypothetical protein [Anaerolineales bacterium]MCC6326097.1 hypothetical protein [Candidatus Brocadia sp.]MCE7910761.1 hypothetical protein [Candidatus Brocadia sp. AMX3]MDG5996261.1 hypothetical protein [Candidatus Brocadia sp.]RIK01868.1 MAG: hypothetical protein DCC43_05185 [Candidatus Brocadia sp.]